MNTIKLTDRQVRQIISLITIELENQPYNEDFRDAFDSLVQAKSSLEDYLKGR